MPQGGRLPPGCISRWWNWRQPTVCPRCIPFATAGGLAAYGPDLGEAAERLASQVDQVLKGAKPGDVPVHQASKFALVINITTAHALDEGGVVTAALRAAM